MSLLKQSHLRHARAKKQLAELEKLIGTIREGVIQAGHSDDQDAMRKVLEDFLGNVWSNDEMLILVSEFIHHLRVALDHIIFVCARIDSGKDQNGTQFPINSKPEFFEKNRAGCLEHLTDEHIALVERFQPYRGSNLKLLNRLSNVDKHKHFVRWSASGSFTTTRMNLGLNEAVAQADPMLKAINPMLRKVGMYFYRGPEVLLDDGTPICEALQILHSEVGNIIREFDAVLK